MPGVVLEQGSFPLTLQAPRPLGLVLGLCVEAGLAVLASPHPWQDPAEMPRVSPLGRSGCWAPPAPSASSAQVRNHSVAGDSARAPGDAQIPAGMEPGAGTQLRALQLPQCLSRPFRELCPAVGHRCLGSWGSWDQTEAGINLLQPPACAVGAFSMIH